MNNPITFDKCPCCLIEWNTSSPNVKCSKCDLKFNSTEIISRKFKVGVIYWYRQGHTIFQNYENMSTITFDEHLAYDITQEQLNLFLTFS